jgi:hypothetical protein
MTAALKKGEAASDKSLTLDLYQTPDGWKVALPETHFSTAASAQAKTEITLGPLNLMATGYRWAPWGDNDCLPTDMRCKILDVPMAASAVERLTKMMYGNGLVYFKNSDLSGGNTDVKRAQIPEVEDFLSRNFIQTKWWAAQCLEYRFFQNTFSEIILSKDKTKITGLFHKQAEFCRIALQNERTLDMDFILYSPDFAIAPPSEGRIKAIPLYSWYDDFEEYLGYLRANKFAWHSHFPTPGTAYYARPMWQGLFREGGWLEVAANVPRIVKAMQINQISLKYQIIIPETYFEVRHKDWQIYSQDKRDEVMNALTTRLEQMLVGVDNPLKTITTFVRQDKTTGAMFGEIKIIAIDDKAKTGVWVPDSAAADFQINVGLGLHPSQAGLSPDKGVGGAGSGSDQRESFNTAISLNTLDQDILLEPLNFISRFNGWGVTFMVDHETHTTTNEQESGIVPGEMTPKIAAAKPKSQNP